MSSKSSLKNKRRKSATKRKFESLKETVVSQEGEIGNLETEKAGLSKQLHKKDRLLRQKDEELKASMKRNLLHLSHQGSEYSKRKQEHAPFFEKLFKRQDLPVIRRSDLT